MDAEYKREQREAKRARKEGQAVVQVLERVVQQVEAAEHWVDWQVQQVSLRMYGRTQGLLLRSSLHCNLYFAAQSLAPAKTVDPAVTSVTGMKDQILYPQVGQHYYTLCNWSYSPHVYTGALPTQHAATSGMYTGAHEQQGVAAPR